MKTNIFYLTVILTTLLFACENAGKNETVKGIDPANLDTSAVPGDDFYRYADGGWAEAHPLRPEHARYTTFDALGESTREQVNSLISELSQRQNEQGSIAQKIGDLYALKMDSDRLNLEGSAPLVPYLEALSEIESKDELTSTLAKLTRDGVRAFFNCYVGADDKNSTMNILHLMAGGFGMGDRDYYLNEDPHSQQLRAKYVEVIEKLFALSGYTSEETKQATEAIMKIETRLAKVSPTRVERRDPEANYHKISLEELQKLSPSINWKEYFDLIGATGLTELDVAQLNPIAEISKIINDQDILSIKYYLYWKVISGATSSLSDAYSDTAFEYFGKALTGAEAQQERWKRAVQSVSGALGQALGQIYVDKYFPPSSKEKMLTLVKNLQTALGERIMDLEWMSDETKAKAMEKLSTFRIKIGYPDKWRDYSELNIDKSLSLFENQLKVAQFSHNYQMSRFNKPVDRDEWFMTPQTVNASYNPTSNEICFPAGILQPPFFNPDADDAVNYGAIGVVIGHEMTHGFDDSGRKYDKDGNLTEWWTAEDGERFTARAKVLVDFFNNIVVIDTVHANGEYTLGENIADQGGLQVSWQAYQNTLKGKTTPAPIDGFTDAQRFFLGYAAVWAGNIRDAEILRRTKMDEHSLARWRVNGALPHIDAWYEAFGVTPDNKMYVPKEQRVSIW